LYDKPASDAESITSEARQRDGLAQRRIATCAINSGCASCRTKGPTPSRRGTTLTIDDDVMQAFRVLARQQGSPRGHRWIWSW
jgi:hypothetical protein